MSEIIIHQDRDVHLSEFMALCLLLHGDESLRINRREADETDLRNPNIVVLGQGGRYQPDLNNFDHRGLPTTNRLSAFGMVLLKVLGTKRAAFFRELFGWSDWIDFREVIGPRRAYHELRISWYAQTESPISLSVLRLFNDMFHVMPETTMHGLMVDIGEDTLHEFEDMNGCLDDVCKRVRREDLSGSVVAFLPKDTDPHVICAWRRIHGQDVTLTVSHERGRTIVYRYGKETRVDLSLLRGSPGVTFAHSGGYTAHFDHEVRSVGELEGALV